MRSALTTMVGLALFTAACGGTTDTTNTSAGSISGSSATGGSTSGGATTGGSSNGGATTGGSSTGLADGLPCSSNAVCGSGICGLAGSGNCCASACNTSVAACGAVGCDSTGTCIYPVQDAGAILCGGTCNGSLLDGFYCDTAGGCTVSTGRNLPCAGNFACADGSSCKTTCTQISDCAKNFYCDNGQCLAQSKTGPCTENNACTSLFCDIQGSGDCCTNQCVPAKDPACDATNCDATSGACVFPNGSACGSPTCTNSKESGGGICDIKGNCVTSPIQCPNNLGCNAAATQCNTTCTTVGDCAKGFYCSSGACIPQITNGPCTLNDECTSLACGVGGTGNCCAVACLSTDPTCGATACDGTTGACNYPPPSTLCGAVDASCTAGVGQPASACDGQGTCNATPAPVPCTPYICGATACLNSCTDNSNCGSGDFCDLANSNCCAAMVASQGVAVDSTAGSDATACCGYGSAGACGTLTQAMKLIDASESVSAVSGITINAKVNGGAGDWTIKTEVYPITLGWGVELNAPGVYFYDPQQTAQAQLFDINFYSKNDTVGFASIVGTAKKPVGIGFNTKNDASSQSNEVTMVQVESGNTLYIANANLNSSWTAWSDNGNDDVDSTAIRVIGGGTLTLGQDKTAAVTGTVTIGNALGDQSTDGWNGIVCTNNAGTGCTITDNTGLAAGTSSIVIEGQENVDIDAEDFATITLKASPVIGIAPKGAGGFLTCPNPNTLENGGKPDAFSSFNYPFGAAVVLNGDVTMTFDNGTVQCISGDGFLLQTSPSGNGNPTLTLDTTKVQNTEYALLALAGTATVTNSTFQYNYNGVQQGTDGTNESAVDLSGGGNTMICASSAESETLQNQNAAPFGAPTPGVDVLNQTSSDLKADNSSWDTKSPDLFSCDSSLTTCTCQSLACTDTAGVNGMNAVYTGGGGVTTTTPTLDKASCGVTCGTSTCTGAQICCPAWLCFTPFCSDSLSDCEDSENCFD